ncbi:hypothetical protein L249_6788, partial [Ophiocordyceps polyrhachis-furcata BCC 54312]
MSTRRHAPIFSSPRHFIHVPTPSSSSSATRPPLLASSLWWLTVVTRSPIIRCLPQSTLICTHKNNKSFFTRMITTSSSNPASKRYSIQPPFHPPLPKKKKDAARPLENQSIKPLFHSASMPMSRPCLVPSTAPARCRPMPACTAAHPSLSAMQPAAAPLVGSFDLWPRGLGVLGTGTGAVAELVPCLVFGGNEIVVCLFLAAASVLDEAGGLGRGVGMARATTGPQLASLAGDGAERMPTWMLFLGSPLKHEIVVADFAVVRRQFGELGHVIAARSDDEIPAVLELKALGLRVDVDPGSEAVLATAGHLTHLLDEAARAGHLECGADDDDGVRASLEVGADHLADGFLVRVELVVEDEARPQATDAVTPLAGKGGANLVRLLTLGARWRLGPVKQVAIEWFQVAALGAHHLLQAAVQLDRRGPGGLWLEGHSGVERVHGGVDAVNVLRVEAQQAALLGEGGDEVVEGGRGGLTGQ